jgi:hypothetical protein
MNIYNIITIESFYPKLIKLREVQKAIEEKLGEEYCKRIIKQFKAKTPYQEIEGDFENVIQDVVVNEGEVVDILTASGGNGEYPIEILNFGPLYWVHAQEYDAIKYFKSYKEAVACAESTYEI